MGPFEKAALILGVILSAASVIALIRKPIKTLVKKVKDVVEGIRGHLRSDMVSIYYHNVDAGTIRQYELQNFLMIYDAYKALGGNSFIDEIHETVMTWKVVT